MFVRISAAEKGEHDDVIKALAEHYESKGLSVETNPGQEQNFTHKDRKPDIRVDAKDHWWIFEVETDNSVVESHGKGHWDEFANLFTFGLVVPKAKKTDAVSLLDKIVNEKDRKKVYVATYTKTDSTYSFENIP